MKPTRALATVLLFSTLVSTSGCSVAGFYIGARTPSYERVTVDTASLSWRDRLHYGEEIGIRAKEGSSHEVGATSPPWRDAIYEGIDDDTLAVSTPDGPDRIPLADIGGIRVRRGSHWVTGVAIGAIVDAIVVGFIVASLTGSSHVDLNPSAAH